MRNKEDIEAGLQDRALRSMSQALTAAGYRLPDLAKAYRSWALAHPRLYELATRRPLRRNELGSGVEAAAAAPIVAAAGGDEHVARTLWGLAHGLVDLELAGRFPPGADIDQTWRTAVETLSSLRRRADPGNGTGPSAVR